MRTAVIDLGSNSFHLLVFNVQRNRDFSVHKRIYKLNLLGSFLGKDNVLPSSAIKNSADLVEDLFNKAKSEGVQEVYIFGTKVFRHAVNIDELTKAIYEKCGCTVDVLSCEEEAECIFLGVQNKYAPKGIYLIVDIGGGSTECIIAENDVVKWFASVPFGTNSLSDLLKAGKNKGEISCFIENVFSPIFRVVEGQNYEVVYGTSGFLRCLSAKLNTGSTKLPELLTTDKLCFSQINDASCSTAWRTATEDNELLLIAAGSRILLEIMQKINADTVCVSSTSTREGYLLKKLSGY